jgi:hypothetical protein
VVRARRRKIGPLWSVFRPSWTGGRRGDVLSGAVRAAGRRKPGLTPPAAGHSFKPGHRTTLAPPRRSNLPPPLTAGQRDRGPHALRGGLLCQGPGRKPDQGAAARPVRRSHVSRHDARQSAPPLVRVLRLCPARRAAPDRAALHPVCDRDLWHHPPQALKIGAQVRTSVRRIKVAMTSACPYQDEYHLAYLYLRRAAAF